jgi:hypothetical protein
MSTERYSTSIVGVYPDNPNRTVTALRDGLFRLFKARKFDEAADYALALTATATRYSPLDTIADRIARRRPHDALALYQMALSGAREVVAGATSGAEGSVFMGEVRRLEKKVAAARERLRNSAGGSGARKRERRGAPARRGKRHC